ncbi:MAG: lytic transglycosylase domain-containing protein, partial [Pseudomonadota bacterium]|nr:lytic transglycosylase domain-containing protein [Pseudomonadota bacterium]
SRIDALLREAWRGGDFEEKQEKEFYKKYHHLMSREDDIQRVSRLLWEDKVTPARRLLPLLPKEYQLLFKARIALIQEKRWAGIAIAEVPRKLKNDPGLLFDRLRYREQRGYDSGSREMLLAAPPQVPYPDRWWRWRETEIIKAVDERNYKLAERLLANHGQVAGSNLADAVWLSGWLKTEFLRQPQQGFEIFRRMYDDVHYPVSRARAAYWAARAAEKAGDKAEARHWYLVAADYPTTFYGQVAALKRGGDDTLHIPPAPAIMGDDRERFAESDLAQAIKIAADLGEDSLASRLIKTLAEDADDARQAALIADFGSKSGHPYLGVQAAKKAMQADVLDLHASYPVPETPRHLAVEKPLALAIGRQESEFDPRAKSPSNALGVMQLKPATARETARKNGLGYSPSRLFDPEYSFTVGSLYLAHLINNYDGSYIMAIAAYNAGPGNVRGWQHQFGTPGTDVDSAVDWIEKIPYTETRNYVQRVIENLQVYRYLEADGRAELKLGKDLVR